MHVLDEMTLILHQIPVIVYEIVFYWLLIDDNTEIDLRSNTFASFTTKVLFILSCHFTLNL